VANNAAFSMLRRRIAEKEKVSMAGIARKIANTPDGGQGSPANEIDFRCLQETLRCCIARLPEHLRNVITLRELAGLSYAQIGRMLGISAATARVYRCKAIRLLAVWMGKEG